MQKYGGCRKKSTPKFSLYEVMHQVIPHPLIFNWKTEFLGNVCGLQNKTQTAHLRPNLSFAQNLSASFPLACRSCALFFLFFFFNSHSELVLCVNAGEVSHSPSQPLHYPRRVFNSNRLVPVYVFLPKTQLASLSRPQTPQFPVVIIHH